MGAKEKILVVDDEPSIRKYLQTLLEVDGFEVEAVSSGKEALERVNKGERPDFIILDVLMPEMSGLDTLKEMMQADRTLNVIMLSCSNEVGTVVEAIRIGAHDYLTKPFEKTELDAADAEVAAEEGTGHGEPGAARLLRSSDRGLELPGGEPADGANPAADPADCAGRRAGFYLRRERSGQRSGGAHDPPAFEAAKPGVREGELRGAAGGTSGIGAIRIRARRFYGRSAQQTGQV